MDTEELTSESFELDLTSADTPTHAAVAEDDTLFVAVGTEIAAIDPSTLEITATWAIGAAVTAMGTLPDGLGAAMTDPITVIEPGKHLRTIPSPTTRTRHTWGCCRGSTPRRAPASRGGEPIVCA